jgi:hypothetical protein
VIRRSEDVAMARPVRNPKVLEYRVEHQVPFAPAVTYRPTFSKRPPSDDISERIGIALYVMKEAKCSHALARVRDALASSGLVPGAYCELPNIKSRVQKTRKVAHEEILMWLRCYWQSKNAEFNPAVVTDWPEFVLAKCDC